MSALLDGGNWWAQVERKGMASEVSYWRVIAWERLDATEFDGKPGLVAWINGREPIRSDQFTARVDGEFVLSRFVDQLPEDADVTSWC